jgi:hypothetical protein
MDQGQKRAKTLLDSASDGILRDKDGYIYLSLFAMSNPFLKLGHHFLNPEPPGNDSKN